ncbi:Testican-1 [Microtus ochrogaster]|uniref:Testican-1 n=1 Tax=Microtus ochrogaster TaxID=79684 RepID=A0A8J6KW50_MICOH|nr:Testican-1 [Microtus ochrogaster]
MTVTHSLSLRDFKFQTACTDKELRNLASRLKDWFGALHEDANRVIKPTSSDTAQGRFDTSILPICKDSLGWMFNKLDMNYDLLLDHSEINAIYLDKYEPCIKPLFNSCDSFKDGKLSNNEWCYCFQKPGGGEEVGHGGPAAVLGTEAQEVRRWGTEAGSRAGHGGPGGEEVGHGGWQPCWARRPRRSTVANAAQHGCQQEQRRSFSCRDFHSGAFVPRCNEEGYYKATQCHGSTGQCWCVDKYGNELAGSRKQGTVSCEEEQETSGDFGSGGSVVLLDDLEDERELGPKDREGKLRVHTRAVREDDEDEDDDKEDEVGYIW